MAANTLSRKAMQSSFWVFSLRASSQILFFIRTIVLARILAPQEFGIFAIIQLSIGLIESVSETGINKALIQKQANIDRYLDTAWTIQIFRNALIALFLFCSSNYVAAFFDAPEVIQPLQIMCAAIFISGFNNIGIIYFQKELEFNRQFNYQIAALFAEMAVSIVVAILLRSVWALVTGHLTGTFMRLILSYRIHSYRPKFEFKKQKVIDLINYGKWVFSSNSIGYFVVNLDNMVIGKLLGSAKLGLFQMAFRLSNMAATEITHVVSQVAFPLYSKVQDQSSRLKNVFLWTMRSVSLVSLPIAGGFFVLTPELVGVILGKKWLPMASALQLLCLVGAVRSITANFGALFLSTGRPDVQTKASLINLVVLAISIYPMVNHFGMMGAVYARLLTFVTQFYTWPIMAKIVNVKFREVATVLLPPCVSTIFMIIVVAGMKTTLIGGNFATICLLVLTGIVAYSISLLCIDYICNFGVRKNIQLFIQTLK